MIGHDPERGTAENYRAFAVAQARGRSPRYEEFAAGVAGDPALLAFLTGLPIEKRQPNLLFAAVRSLAGVLPDYPAFRAAVLARRDEVAAVMLARRGSSSPARTYGWHRAEVFTAVANAALLIGVALFILYEAVERLKEAPSIPGMPMIVVALAGLAANLVVALLLRSHSSESLAVRGASFPGAFLTAGRGACEVPAADSGQRYDAKVSA